MFGLMVLASKSCRLAMPSALMAGMDIRRLMKGRASASSRNTLIAEAVLYMSPSSMDDVLMNWPPLGMPWCGETCMQLLCMTRHAAIVVTCVNSAVDTLKHLIIAC